MSPTGDVLWHRLLGGMGETGSQDEHVIALKKGFIFEGLGNLTERRLAPWIVRVDESGEPVWARAYLSPERKGLWPKAIREAGDGSLYMGGLDSEDLAAFVAKLNHEGELIWARKYDISGSEHVEAIATSSDNGLLAVGQMRSVIWLLRLSPKGELLWQKAYGHHLSDAIAVESTSDGGFLVLGRLHAEREGETWVLKLKANGVEEWQIKIGGPAMDQLESATEIENSGFLLAGSTESFGTDKGKKDIWIIKLDKLGNLLWQRLYGGPKHDGSFYGSSTRVDIGATQDGGAFIAASTESFGAGLTDTWILRIDPDGEVAGCSSSPATDATVSAVDLPVTILPIETSPIKLTVEKLNVQMVPTKLASSAVCSVAIARSTQGASVPSAALLKPAQPSAEASKHPAAVSPESSLPADSNTLAAEVTKFVGEVSNLLVTRNFAALEELASQLRRSKARFSSGSLKLDLYYEALHKPPSLEQERYLELLDAWIAASPSSPTPYIVKANAHQAFAWKARGSEFADTVTDAGWEEFKREGRRALATLQKAGPLAGQDPVYYRVYIDVLGSHGLDEDEMNAKFAQGAALEPTYFQLYRARANFLRPEWGGEEGAVERFAARSADLTRNTIGEELYARIAIWMAWRDGRKVFTTHKFSWPRVKQGFLDIQKRYPGSSNTHSFLWLAWLNRDRDTARALLKQPEARWNADAGKDWKNPDEFNSAKSWAKTAAEPWMDGKAQPRATASSTTPPTKEHSTAPATITRRWVDDFAKNWPTVVLSVDATLDDGQKITDATAFLLDLDGKVYGVTTAALIQTDAKKQVTSQDALPRIRDLVLRHEKGSLKTGSVVSTTKAPQTGYSPPTGVVFTIRGNVNRIPIQALKPRTKPIALFKPVFIVQCVRKQSGCEQRVLRGRVNSTNIGTGRTYGWMSVQLDENDKVDLDQLLGAPILDEEGLVAGIVARKFSMTGGYPPAAPGEEIGYLFNWQD